MSVLYVLANVVSLLLTLLNLAMLLRAVFSWFPELDDSAFGDFLYMITEPFIIPVRAILNRFSGVQNSPIDISFLVTCLLLLIVRTAFSEFATRLL